MEAVPPKTIQWNHHTYKVTNKDLGTNQLGKLLLSNNQYDLYAVKGVSTNQEIAEGGIGYTIYKVLN